MLCVEGHMSSSFLPVKMSIAVKLHLACPCLPVFDVDTSTTCTHTTRSHVLLGRHMGGAARPPPSPPPPPPPRCRGGATPHATVIASRQPLTTSAFATRLVDSAMTPFPPRCVRGSAGGTRSRRRRGRPRTRLIGRAALGASTVATAITNADMSDSHTDGRSRAAEADGERRRRASAARPAARASRARGSCRVAKTSNPPTRRRVVRLRGARTLQGRPRMTRWPPLRTLPASAGYVVDAPASVFSNCKSASWTSSSPILPVAALTRAAEAELRPQGWQARAAAAGGARRPDWLRTAAHDCSKRDCREAYRRGTIALRASGVLPIALARVRCRRPGHPPRRRTVARQGPKTASTQLRVLPRESHL